jgi:hypothetical protein
VNAGELPEPCPDWALFLDFDGCIVDIASTPEAARVPDGLASLLVALREALGGAVAIVSGRPIEQIDGFLGEAGTDKSRILSATVYMADLSQKDAMNEVWMAWLEPACLPARAASNSALALASNSGCVSKSSPASPMVLAARIMPLAPMLEPQAATVCQL